MALMAGLRPDGSPADVFMQSLLSVALGLAASASAKDPMLFFAGRTEGDGTMTVTMRKGYRSQTHGHGRIEADGSLFLAQQVEEEGKPPRQRIWRIRRLAEGRYTGTMSEAEGPVAIEAIDGRYRFRFGMKGGLSVEQWLIPIGDGSAVQSRLTARKFGITVARGDGIIRKISAP